MGNDGRRCGASQRTFPLRVWCPEMKRDYIIQPLVELYEDCMVVLKVS
jgi:hypothetical protein